MTGTPVSALTIAGSDSGGGAGIQADLATFAAYGVHGATALTAVTVQDTTGVHAVHPLPADLVVAQSAAVLADPVARRYVSGVAWHCYGGDVRVQAALHDAHPDKETYFTECSGGEWAPRWADSLNFFVRTLMIGSTRGWAKGVLLWNLALDEKHGPHLGGCGNCRGVVTIDSASGEVTRNVEYYALAHASRFVRQGARRIFSSSGHDGLDSVAFRNADDGSIALLVFNGAKQARDFSVRVGARSFGYALAAGSVATFTWGGKR